MKRLQDKVAVITGAGSGIGRETVLLFLEHGANVILGDMNKETLEETFEIIKQKNFEKNACVCCVDVSKEKDIESLIDTANNEFGALDILFNNAGIGGAVGPVTHIDADEWDKSFQILLKSVFLGTKYAARVMKDNPNGGSIINISSQLGKVGAPNRSVYNMTKFGIEGLTRGMALDLAKNNIRVNTICPTFVETPLVKNFFKDKLFKKTMMANIPLGRFATVSDIATAIVYLASDASSMITGSSLVIDGGWTSK